PTSTSKCAYRRRRGGKSSCAPLSCDCCSSDCNPQSARHRTHSPFGPVCVIRRPHVIQTPTAGFSSSPLFTNSGFGEGSAVHHRHPPTPKPCWPPPHETCRDSVVAPANATCAMFRPALQVALQPLPASVAALSLPLQRRALADQAPRLCLRLQILDAAFATPA